MRVLHSRQHIEKQSDAHVDIEPVAVAITVDVVTVNIVENEIGLARLRHSCIDQFSDVRLNQKAEYSGLVFGAIFAGLP